MKKKYLMNSVEDTENFAGQLAKTLRPPQVIALSGDLGAGKTTFVRAFVKALPNSENVRVKSPSYSLLNTYDTYPKVHHLDLYRLSNRQDFEDLGLWEVIHSEADLVLIEWPELILDGLADTAIRIFFEDVSDEVRSIELISSINLNLT